jgi:hypothetical protein
VATAVAIVIVVCLFLALGAGLLYYKSSAESSEKDAAETELGRDVAEDRAERAEDAAARRAAERFQEAKKRAENATLDSALRDWVAAGKLWRTEREDSGEAGDAGAVPPGSPTGDAGRGVLRPGG